MIDKFNEMMLKKRKRSDSRELSNELPSKRQKRSSMQKDVDTVVAQSEYIRRYINQRQLVTDTQKARCIKNLRKIGRMKLSQLTKLSKLA